jgi:hypothetical protein
MIKIIKTDKIATKNLSKVGFFAAKKKHEQGQLVKESTLRLFNLN